MERLKDILARWSASLLALALVFQFSVPHLHASTDHDAEICTGHLGDASGGAGDGESYCLQCVVAKRLRVVSPAVPSTAVHIPIALGPCADQSNHPPCPLLLTGPGGPRAPPLARS